MTKALGALTAEELKACGRDGLAAARELGNDVTIVGFSTGGTIAAWLALTERLSHVVLVAPFFASLWVPRRLTGIGIRLLLRLPDVFLWWDPIKRENLMPEHGYPRYSLHAASQVLRLAQEILQATDGPASERVTIVVNASEATVSNSAIEELFQVWHGRRHGVEMIRLGGLPISHDIIEPERAVDPVATVYPRLLTVLELQGRNATAQN